MPRISQRDVAQACGVDQKTVSRVFVQPASVAVGTRERVLAAAARIGYVAVRPAQRVHGRRPVVLLEDPNPFRSTLDSRALRALSATLAAEGVDLIHLTLPDEAFRDARALLRRLCRYAAGVLILNYQGLRPDGLDGHLARIGLPALWLNQRLDAACIHPDDEGGSHLLTTRLLAMGHRRIAYLQPAWPDHGAIGDHYSIIDRRTGYRRAMREAGLEPRVIDITYPAEVAPSWSRERAMFGAVLAARDRPTACLCYNAEVVALGAAMLERGLTCPGDVSLGVVGATATLDGWWRFSGTWIDWEGMCRMAAQMALAAMAEPSAAVPAVALPHGWLDGETLGPPRR